MRRYVARRYPRPRPIRRYAGPWLGQEPPVEALPAGGEEGPAQDLTGTQATSFRGLWERFTGIWPAFLGLERELQDRASAWRLVAVDKYRANDIEGYRAIQTKIRQLEALEARRKDVEAQVRRFKDAWEALRSYIANAGRWLGIQGLAGPDLGLPPLLLVIGIPAALGALAYVVNTYFAIRADLDADLQVLRELQAGRLTPAQAAAFAAARKPAPQGFWGALGGGLAMPLVVIGGGLLALLAFRGGGSRA